MLAQHDAEEIVINGSRGAFMMSSTAASRAFSIPFPIDAIIDCCQQMAWDTYRRLDALHPSCGGAIQSLNLRWHAVLPPVATDEILLSVRRHQFSTLTLDNFNLSTGVLTDIELAINKKSTLLIAGSTGSGKTSLLVAVLHYFFSARRVVILESVPEIPLLNPGWIKLVESTHQDQRLPEFRLENTLKETLRLRPDVLVVAEMRGHESFAFMEAQNVGVNFCAGTIHASSIESAVQRLKYLSHGAVGRPISKDSPFSGTCLHLERTSADPRPNCTSVHIG